MQNSEIQISLFIQPSIKALEVLKPLRKLISETYT
jgi:hypothetical protein